MTGAELAIRTDDQPLPEKAILLGETAYTERVLGSKPGMASLGEDGFRLVAAGNRLCIIGGRSRGTLYGVYELLERHWGCRWYASFHSVIPRHETLTLPPLDDTQVPAFAMREPHWWEMRNGDFAARCRANGNGMALADRHGGKIRFGGGLFVHTFYRLVPPAEFFDKHPEYFSLIDGKRQIGFSQLCLTNPDVLRIVTERVLAAIRKDPTAKLFSVSQNDWDGHCQCERCREIDRREESPAGTLIQFVNQVAERVEREFPRVWIETLAYQYTRKPPKTIRPRHNVVPRLCTIECDFSQPLPKSSYPQNVRFVQDIKGWSAITDKLYVWDYTTNFHNFVGPHPNFPAIPGNIRFFRDNRVVGLFEQGANDGPHAEFGELRAWLLAKLLWNPDRPVDALLDDFFAGYYGAAAAPIREYFDKLQTLCTAPGCQSASLMPCAQMADHGIRGTGRAALGTGREAGGGRPRPLLPRAHGGNPRALGQAETPRRTRADLPGGGRAAGPSPCGPSLSEGGPGTAPPRRGGPCPGARSTPVTTSRKSWISRATWRGTSWWRLRPGGPRWPPRPAVVGRPWFGRSREKATSCRQRGEAWRL